MKILKKLKQAVSGGSADDLAREYARWIQTRESLEEARTKAYAALLDVQEKALEGEATEEELKAAKAALEDVDLRLAAAERRLGQLLEELKARAQEEIIEAQKRVPQDLEALERQRRELYKQAGHHLARGFRLLWVAAQDLGREVQELADIFDLPGALRLPGLKRLLPPEFHAGVEEGKQVEVDTTLNSQRSHLLVLSKAGGVGSNVFEDFVDKKLREWLKPHGLVPPRRSFCGKRDDDRLEVLRKARQDPAYRDAELKAVMGERE